MGFFSDSPGKKAGPDAAGTPPTLLHGKALSGVPTPWGRTRTATGMAVASSGSGGTEHKAAECCALHVRHLSFCYSHPFGKTNYGRSLLIGKRLTQRAVKGQNKQTKKKSGTFFPKFRASPKTQLCTDSPWRMGGDVRAGGADGGLTRVQQEEEPGVRRDCRAPSPGGVAGKTQRSPGWSSEAGTLVGSTWSKSYRRMTVASEQRLLYTTQPHGESPPKLVLQLGVMPL